jgi:hypothetical protein
MTTIEIIIPKELVLVDDRFYGTGKYAGCPYIGMNWWAAQEIGCKFPFDKTQAVVVKSVAVNHGGWPADYGIEEIFLHEQQEAQFMQFGLDYPDAHARTTDLVGPSWERPAINHNKVLRLVKA